MWFSNRKFSVIIPWDETVKNIMWTDSCGRPTLCEEIKAALFEKYAIREMSYEVVNYSVGGLFLKINCNGHLGFMRITDLLLEIVPYECKFIKSANKIE